MKARLLLAILILSTSAYAQRELDDDTWSLKNRGYAGLGFGGLSFGSDPYVGQYFTIGGSVLGGYMLTENLSTGVGVEYQFTSLGDIGVNMHTIGGYPFLRYRITDFFGQVDYAMYSLEQNPGTEFEKRVIKERFFLGIGYAPRSNGRSTFNALLCYDLLYENRGVFFSPIAIRVFVTFH